MTSEQIMQAIPHRPPMLLVDEIVERAENSITTTKTFRADEFFVQGHYPNQPIVPGVILCEAGMQTGAILLSHLIQESGESLGGRVPVVGRMKDVKFKQMVRPGDTVRIQATLKEKMSAAYIMSATLHVDAKLAAQLSFICTLAEVPE